MKNLDELKLGLDNCDSEKKAIEIKNIFNKKYLSPLYEELKTSANKKILGQEINEYKKAIDELVNIKIMNINLLKDSQSSAKIDANFFLKTFPNGVAHILNETINDIINFFKKYNFEFVNGEEITTSIFNFDNLNIGIDHVARNEHDTFFINSKYLLRTHCTSSTAKILLNNSNSDIRVFSFGNVYRKDEDDATHSHQFCQVDIVWLRSNLNLANLKFLINQLIHYLFGYHLQIRYRLSYFPFTEPSFEVDVECNNCHGSGCYICKQSGWIEILGAGMLNQAVIKKAGIKHINSALAAGIGIERIAMIKYGIKDIRDFYNNDFDLLTQFRK